MLERLRLAGDLDRKELDAERRSVLLMAVEQGSERRGLDTELLAQFPDCRGLEGLVRLQLASRELPEPAVPLVWRSQADEVSSLALDHRGKYPHHVAIRR